MVPLVPETQPDLSTRSVFISAGAFDALVPPSSTRELVELLRSSGANVDIRFLQSGHELTAEDVDLAREYLTHLRD